MGKCDLQWNMNAIVSLFASSHRATKNRSLLFVQLVVGMCVCVCVSVIAYYASWFGSISMLRPICRWLNWSICKLMPE